MEAVVFFVCAVAVLAGALGVILARNPVHSALFLLMTLVGVAVLYLQLAAALVAAIQIVVYASAIVVLFLFVITLLGVDRVEASESADSPRRLQTPAAIVLGVLFVIGWGFRALYQTPVDAIPDLSENQVIVFSDWPGRSPQEVEDQISYPLTVNLQGLQIGRAHV